MRFILFASCFFIFLLMPVDAFPLGMQILREFGARPLNFIQLAMATYLIPIIILNFKINRHVIYLMLLLMVFIMHQSLVLLYSSMFNYSIDYRYFITQGLMFLWMFISYWLWYEVFNVINISSVLNSSRPNYYFSPLMTSSFLIALLFYFEYFHGFDGGDYLSLIRQKTEFTRASSMSSEPSLYGAWGNFILPLLFLLFPNNSRSKFAVVIFGFVVSFIFISLFMSGARTFIVVLILQIFVFSLPGRWYLLIASLTGVVLYPLAFIMFKDIDLSLLARLTSSYTAFEAILHNPFFGYGVGQFTYHFSDFVPAESLISNEVLSWYAKDSDIRVSTFSVPLRIFFEFGIIGVIFLYCAIYLPASYIDESTVSKHKKRMLYALLVGGQAFLYSQDQYGYQPAIFSTAFVVAVCNRMKIELN